MSFTVIYGSSQLMHKSEEDGKIFRLTVFPVEVLAEDTCFCDKKSPILKQHKVSYSKLRGIHSSVNCECRGLMLNTILFYDKSMIKTLLMK